MTNIKKHSKYKRLSYSVRRSFVDDFFLRYVPQLPQEGLFLDLGGHKIRKRGKFDIRHYNLNVTCFNLTVDKHPDVQADAIDIPCKDNYFDGVICAELLEHVINPIHVLQEIYRVLRPNGILLISVPFLYHIHGDPYDFGRYTNHYWQYHLEKTGFQDITIEHQGLFYSVMLGFCKIYLNKITYPKPFGRIMLHSSSLFTSVLQEMALRHEQKPHVRANSLLSAFTTGFGIKAIKK